MLYSQRLSSYSNISAMTPSLVGSESNASNCSPQRLTTSSISSFASDFLSIAPVSRFYIRDQSGQAQDQVSSFLQQTAPRQRRTQRAAFPSIRKSLCSAAQSSEHIGSWQTPSKNKSRPTCHPDRASILLVDQVCGAAGDLYASGSHNAHIELPRTTIQEFNRQHNEQGGKCAPRNFLSH